VTVTSDYPCYDSVTLPTVNYCMMTAHDRWLNSDSKQNSQWMREWYDHSMQSTVTSGFLLQCC